MGAGVLTQKHGAYALKQDVEKKDHSDKLRQRKDDHLDNQVRSSQDRADQRVLPPLGIRGLQQQETHPADFNAQLGPGMDTDRDCVGEHTQRNNPTREALQTCTFRVPAIKNLFDALVTPTITYGAGTWTTTKNTKKRLALHNA